MRAKHGSSRYALPKPKVVLLSLLLSATVLLISSRETGRRYDMPRLPYPTIRQLPRVREGLPPPRPPVWHPPHRVKVWTAVYRGRTFRVIQMPRCEHIETIIAYNLSGETLKQAKVRLGGVAACTGSFHHPQSFALADFLQLQGAVRGNRNTGRWFLATYDDGRLAISRDYAAVVGKADVSAAALGQLLVPFMRDGFSTAFMNKVTDRMAIGLNRNFIFVVQGKSDIWRLAHFMAHELPCDIAINSDGGHVVRGVAPVHIVFRWRTAKATSQPFHASPLRTD